MKKTRLLLFASILFSKFLFAQTPYIGEIRLFAGNFAPYGWAFCDGSLLQISENDTLFALIGTTYGGDGQSTFAVPDLRGRVPIGVGQGAGLSNRVLGEKIGQETVTITAANVPSHSHTGRIVVSNANATTTVPSASSSIGTSGSFSGRTFLPNLSYNTSVPDILLQTVTTSSVGTSTPVSITKPRLGINYIISLFGIFPSQN
ncbi:phage tail protein [Flavobacterium nackdongense]|uniref:Phage tail protein n=1 Tax=Flavobacterium nackdongense TaxID=2547394 RepID=A0A4P6YAP7_9FLAO|nr:tail fiber protein [Flavobacterium nackdongense]QBN20166.1 phage tail protein [Flavobacterium nackdongense]